VSREFNEDLENSLLAKIKEGNEAKLLMMTFAHRYLFIYFMTQRYELKHMYRKLALSKRNSKSKTQI
jgi:hypothetical protein